jgi:hypothetical protein
MSTDDELARVLIERLARLGFALVPAISDVSIALDDRVLPFRSDDEYQLKSPRLQAGLRAATRAP